MTQAYPLQWPDGWPRSTKHEQARFRVSFARARDGLIAELGRMGAPDWNVVISSNVPLRQDGLPYATAKDPEDPGVAVYFRLESDPYNDSGSGQLCIPCDRWDTARDNLQAIRKTVEALRGLDRWGAKHMVDAAFRGFQALPDPGARTWREVLGVPADTTLENAQAMYRWLRSQHHPDKGGDPAKFNEIQKAWEQARRELL